MSRAASCALLTVHHRAAVCEGRRSLYEYPLLLSMDERGPERRVTDGALPRGAAARRAGASCSWGGPK